MTRTFNVLALIGACALGVIVGEVAAAAKLNHMPESVSLTYAQAGTGLRVSETYKAYGSTIGTFQNYGRTDEKVEPLGFGHMSNASTPLTVTMASICDQSSNCKTLILTHAPK
jgi:hypothetical protein